MIDLISASKEMLENAGFSVQVNSANNRRMLAFEDGTVLGFLLVYESPAALISQWQADGDEAVSEFQFALRRAGKKAWNTYLVLLSGSPSDFAQSVAISAIEEDLRGTRKLARAGVNSTEAVHSALLPLLPIANAPKLDAVDMRAEIRERTTELPARLVQAFLSDAEESLVIQAFEEPR